MTELKERIAGFLQEGLDYKRQEEYTKAKESYLKALVLDNKNYGTYMGLAKVYYLLNEGELAMNSYLAAIHLNLHDVERGIETGELGMLERSYEEFPKDKLAVLPKKSAFTICIDRNTPRHYMHAFYDFSQEFESTKNSALENMIECYKATIRGDDSLSKVLAKIGINAADFREFEEVHYLSNGINFLISDIKWDQLDSDDVVNLYNVV